MQPGIQISNDPQFIEKVHQSVEKYRPLWGNQFDLPHDFGHASVHELQLTKGLHFVLTHYRFNSEITVDSELLQARLQHKRVGDFPSLHIHFFIAQEGQQQENLNVPAKSSVFHIHFEIHHDYIIDLSRNLSEDLPATIISLLNGTVTDRLTDVGKSKSKILYSVTRLLNNRQKGIAYNMYLESKALEILTQIFQHFTAEESGDYLKKFSLKEADKEKIKTAKKWIHDNIEQHISIKELSRLVGLNESYLKRGFKEMFGVTIYEFTQDERIVKAKVLLATRQFTVSEIADKMGYSCLSHFSVNFKKYTGINPTDFMEQL